MGPTLVADKTRVRKDDKEYNMKYRGGSSHDIDVKVDWESPSDPADEFHEAKTKQGRQGDEECGRRRPGTGVGEGDRQKSD